MKVYLLLVTLALGYLDRCNTYKSLNRRNSRVSLVVEELLASFFFFADHPTELYRVKVRNIKRLAADEVETFC
jgi:hypothetical protein